jgi:hypothetical protein
VGEQHAAAAVARESQVVQRLSIKSHSLGQSRSPAPRVGIADHIPLSEALAAVRVDQLDVFGPEVSDDLARRLLLVFLVAVKMCRLSVFAYLAAGEAAHGNDHFGGSRRSVGGVFCRREIVVSSVGLVWSQFAVWSSKLKP